MDRIPRAKDGIMRDCSLILAATIVFGFRAFTGLR
jgi:hypothetical protein